MKKSNIVLKTIDDDYPKIGKNNSIQGFRDNFSAIKLALTTAKEEIDSLLSKKISISGDVQHTVVNFDDSVIKIPMVLKPTGVIAGKYSCPIIQVSEDGRIKSIEDGGNSFLQNTGGTVDGDLEIKGKLSVKTIDEMDVSFVNQFLTMANTDNGFVVRRADGKAVNRKIIGKNGINVRNGDGVYHDVIIEPEPHWIVVDGDVNGKIKVNSIGDLKLTLKFSSDVPRTSGFSMEGPLSLNNQYLSNPRIPQKGHHVGDRDYNDKRYLRNPVNSNNGLLIITPDGEVKTRYLTTGKGLKILYHDGKDNNPCLMLERTVISFEGDVQGFAVLDGTDTTAKIKLVSPIRRSELKNFIRCDSVVENFEVNNLTVGTINGKTMDDLYSMINEISNGVGIISANKGSLEYRSLLGEPDQVVITNGDGVGGNTVIGLKENPTIPGRSGIKIPSGKDGHRDKKALPGTIRYNETQDAFEGLLIGGWQKFPSTSDVPVSARNIGNGIGIFGELKNGEYQFKTLKSDGLVDIKEIDDEIIISTTSEINLAQNEGNGIGLYSRKENDTFYFKSITSNDINVIDKGDHVDLSIKTKMMNMTLNGTHQWDISYDILVVDVVSDGIINPINFKTGSKCKIILKYGNDVYDVKIKNTYLPSWTSIPNTVDIIDLVSDGNSLYGSVSHGLTKVSE